MDKRKHWFLVTILTTPPQSTNPVQEANANSKALPFGHDYQSHATALFEAWHC